MLSWLKGDKVDHPLANAKRVKQLIDSLPYRDPWQTLEDVNHWLDSINDTPEFKLDSRFELIDTLDVATRKCQEQLVVAYLTLGEEGRIQERRISKTVTEFWTRLGNGYLACARQASDSKNVPHSFRPLLPVIAVRGLRAIRQQIKWVLMRYGVTRPEMWGECGRFAILAESVDAAATQIEIYAGSKARSSSNYELLRVMMLWATSPSGLSPLEQDIAERFVVHFTPKFRFSTRRQDECDYFFDLFGSRPPLRFVSSSPISDATRYFDAGEARQAVDAMMVSMVTSTGNLPADFELGPATEPNVVARVLKHLKLNWAKEMPARASERRKTALRLHVVHGYQGVLGAVAPGNAEGLDFSNTLSHDSWVAEDASAGGYGVIVPAGKGEWLRVGVLVAVRSETESSWNLGVIRRVKGDDYRQYHIGIQLISKSAVPVQLRTLTAASAGRKRQSAILLSERPSRAGSLHIVVRRDLFSGREPIEALYGKHESGVRLDPGGVVETGDDFDWLRYKRLESAA